MDIRKLVLIYFRVISFMQEIAFNVLGNPIYGRQTVIASIRSSRVLPTFKLPLTCDFNWFSHPPKELKMQNVSQNFLYFIFSQ